MTKTCLFLFRYIHSKCCLQSTINCYEISNLRKFEIWFPFHLTFCRFSWEITIKFTFLDIRPAREEIRVFIKLSKDEKLILAFKNNKEIDIFELNKIWKSIKAVESFVFKGALLFRKWWLLINISFDLNCCYKIRVELYLRQNSEKN